MEINIVEKFCYPLEISIIMCYSYFPELSSKENYKKELEESGIFNEKFLEDNLALINQIVATFEKKMIKSDDDAFFFDDKSWAYHLTNPLIIILMEYESLLDDINVLSEEEMHSKLAMRLFGEVPKGIAETTELIQNSNLEFSQSVSWKLLLMFKNPKKYLEQFIQIIKRNIPAFDYTVKQQKRTVNILMSLLRKETSLIKDSLKKPYPLLDETGLPESITVYPSLIGTDSFISFDGNNFYVGRFFQDFLQFHFPDEAPPLEDISPTLKILGDASKYEILKFLKDVPKYNSEIAEHLSLTPATTSHHMSVLIMHGLVTAERIEKRVYYSIAAERVKEILANVEQTLL